MDFNFAIVVPMANESKDFDGFIAALRIVLDNVGCGMVYMVVDNVSTDNTPDLCHALSMEDPRFRTVFEPLNKNIVDAYLRGYSEAYNNNHDYIIEMDAGMSHDPRAIPMFLRVLNEGNECAFGSRFINGGSIQDSNFKRVFLSRFGTLLSNVLLGSKLYDMTSGFQGFHRDIVKQVLDYGLLSKAHFYQTEVRYLLRKKRYAEIPIHYRAPSPGVSQRAINDSVRVLMHYFVKRICLDASIIK
jgi:dolichol-phosphate mannosyltransferase